MSTLGHTAATAEAPAYALLLSLSETLRRHLRRELPEEADDLTQAVLMKAFEALKRGDGPEASAFKAWVFRIAHNELCNYRKKHDRLAVADAEQLDRSREAAGFVEPPALGWVTHDGVSVQFDRLSAREQQVLELRFRFGLSHAEIARAVGYSGPEVVRTTQKRAIQKLKASLRGTR